MMKITHSKILLMVQIIGLIYASENGNITVTVTANPSRVSTQPQDIEFTCEYTGFNQQNELGFLTWYFMTKEVYIYNSDGNQKIIDPKYTKRLTYIQLSNTTMIFTLSKAGLCDTGRYTCRVYDKDRGRVQNSVTVTKKDTPMMLEIHHGGIGNGSCVSCKTEAEKRIITLRTDETSNIRCLAVNPPSPGPKLKWSTVPEYEGETSLYPYADASRCLYGKFNELFIKLSTSRADEMYIKCVAEFSDGRRMETPVITIREIKDDDANAAHSDGTTNIIIGTIGGGLFVGVISGIILCFVVWSKNKSLKDLEMRKKGTGAGASFLKNSHV